MTLEEFIALPQKHQLDTIGDLGIFLSKRNDVRREITSFRINDFVVEVHFCLDQLRITQLRLIPCAAEDPSSIASEEEKPTLPVEPLGRRPV